MSMHEEGASPGEEATNELGRNNEFLSPRSVVAGRMSALAPPRGPDESACFSGVMLLMEVVVN